MGRSDEFYHGSSRDFDPGDLVLPQRETGAPNWAEQVGHSGELGPHYSGEHVYHSTSMTSAAQFGKYLYQVEPLTPVEPDPEGKVSPEFGASEPWTRNKGAARVVRKVDYR